MECSLFHQTKYQYGPACAYTAGKGLQSVLVYYPLGSGKTLSAIHAARMFLDSNPEGKVCVITTKSNIQTSWSTNIQQYVHAENVNLERVDVRNIDWWFSEGNLPHFNKVMRLLSSKSGNNRCAYVDLPWRTLLQSSSKATQNEFKTVFETRSFLDACVPSEPFMFIVDECQQYLNSTSQQQLVAKLCKHSSFTILLSATPLNNASQEVGLCRMLRSHTLENRILYVPPQENMVSVKHRYIGVKMTPEEVSNFVKNKKDDAYLTKGRQLCNTETKFTKMMTKIGKKTVIYSFFRENGVEGFFNFLLGKTTSVSKNYLKITIQSRTIHVKIFANPEEDIQWFNRPSSKNKMLLLTSKARLGISLMGVDTFHIMEPQWTYADEAQAVGRATRMGSHEQGQTVTVFHWVSTAGKYESSDEIVHNSMEAKKKRTDRVLARYAKMGTEYLSELLDKI